MGTKLVKIGAKIVTHARYVTFQMAEVAVPRDLFGNILPRIAELRLPPARRQREAFNGHWCANGRPSPCSKLP